jgi:Ca-activated chloride channel family protein
VIRFGAPLFLLVGLGLVLVVALAWWRYEKKRGKALARFAGDLARRLAHAETDLQRRARWALRLAGLAALVVAAAAPRWGEEVVRVSTQGSDLVLVFDTSASMDARDVPPTRLEEAKREALALLDDLAGDRVAVVAFAGDAVALSPLTLDRSAARLLIEALQSDVVSTPGSDLGRGLRTALRLLPEGEAGQQAIVLFTDGEDLEGGLAEATSSIERRGIRVFAVGVGTPAGETIPVLDDRGYQVGVKTDPNGQPVVSRLDVNALRNVAERTRGRFLAAQHPGGELARLKAAVATVGSGAREGRLGSRPVERFPLFALVAWILFVASWLLPERRTVLPRALTGARRPRAAALVLFLGLGAAAALLLLPAPARAAHPLVEGNRLYAQGNYGGAIRVYREALVRAPNDPALLANLGAALYRTNDWKGAEEAYARAQAAVKDQPAIAARAGQGRGNALFRQERYREALDAYRAALEAAPADADARFNYELTLRKLRPEDTPEEPPAPDDPNQEGPGGGGGGGGGGAPPQPSAPQNRPPTPAPAQPPPAPGQAGQLSRAEAERLLEALQNGERQVRGAQRRGASGERPRERDW